MKYIHQITLILAISFGGELLHHIIPLPIPGSIYGLIGLFLLLTTGAVKLSQVKDVGDFLITLMPLMFVAPIVALINYFDDCREFIVPMLLVATVSTTLVMVVTGRVSQAIIRARDKKEAQK